MKIKKQIYFQKNTRNGYVPASSQIVVEVAEAKLSDLQPAYFVRGETIYSHGGKLWGDFKPITLEKFLGMMEQGDPSRALENLSKETATCWYMMEEAKLDAGNRLIVDGKFVYHRVEEPRYIIKVWNQKPEIQVIHSVRAFKQLPDIVRTYGAKQYKEVLENARAVAQAICTGPVPDVALSESEQIKILSGAYIGPVSDRSGCNSR